MSLRTLHLVFVLAVIVLSDMFGAWAINEHRHVGGATNLALWLISFGIGFGAVIYAIWFVRKLDAAKVE